MDEDEMEMSAVLSDDAADELLHLEQDEDDGSVRSDLSDEDTGGFSNHHQLEGFSFPGDEKDWN